MRLFIHQDSPGHGCVMAWSHRWSRYDCYIWTLINSPEFQKVRCTRSYCQTAAAQHRRRWKVWYQGWGSRNIGSDPHTVTLKIRLLEPVCMMQVPEFQESKCTVQNPHIWFLGPKMFATFGARRKLRTQEHRTTKLVVWIIGYPEPDLIPITWLHVAFLSFNPECVNTSLNNVPKGFVVETIIDRMDGTNKMWCQRTPLPKMATEALRVFLHIQHNLVSMLTFFLICDELCIFGLCASNFSWSLDDMAYGGKGILDAKIKPNWNQYWFPEDWIVIRFLKLFLAERDYKLATFWHKCSCKSLKYAILPPPNFGGLGTRPPCGFSGSSPFRTSSLKLLYNLSNLDGKASSQP